MPGAFATLDPSSPRFFEDDRLEPPRLHPPARPPRLLDQVRRVLRTRHYSHRTEQAYVGWIRRFILHHGKLAYVPQA